MACTFAAVLCRQVLVLVHSIRGRPGATSYAGLLLERGRRGAPAGAQRSAAALLGRLLLALLFVYAGYVQLRRIALRDWALTSAHRWVATACDLCICMSKRSNDIATALYIVLSHSWGNQIMHSA